MEYFDLSSGIAFIGVIAFFCGLLFERFKQPAILGYILAGILLKIMFPEFLDTGKEYDLVKSFAHIGIIILLFLIGMELDLRAFKNVVTISFCALFFQLLFSYLVMLFIGTFLGWSSNLIFILTCALALSSTAVTFKILESIEEIQTDAGRLTIGILIAQDLAIIPILLIVKNMGKAKTEALFSPFLVFILICSMLFLAIFVWYFSRREKFKFPLPTIVEGKSELKPIFALAFCFFIAMISEAIQLSDAYGAFLAGLILGNTTAKKKLINSIKPIQTLFLMVFFLSVGLLINIHFIWKNIGTVLVLLFFITIGKTILNIFILNILRRSWAKAFISSISLAQMGEFSILLTNVAFAEGVINGEMSHLVLSLSALSLAISPFWTTIARRLHEARPSKIQTVQQIMSTTCGTEYSGLKYFFQISFSLFKKFFIGIKNLFYKDIR